MRSGRTSANGIARARYRFLATTELRHYRFRAVVPRQAGYPYLTGRSASRKVTVRPR
ncbi:MAG: hypothetical protein H0W09_04765 [Solirubrobacterales bacterium]|nr:hypothetical protein [Solirubrobacterales bacterium]